MRGGQLGIVVMLALSISACSLAGVSLVSQKPATIYSSNEYVAEATTRSILVVVSGGAFGLGQSALTQAVIDDMQGADWGPHAHFTSVSDDSVGRMYSLVMMVNGPKNVTAASLCETPAQVRPASEPTNSTNLHIVGGVCRYTQLMMGVEGWASGINGPQDPKFSALVGDITQELTRPVAPNWYIRD